MLIGCVAAIVVVGAGCFYGGMLYEKSKAVTQNFTSEQRQVFGRMQKNGDGQARMGNRASGAGFVNGDIISKDDKSITVKSSDGGSKIIFLSESTKVMKSVDSDISDLKAGKNVMISGSANADGSITAESIQLRPNVEANATSTPIK